MFFQDWGSALGKERTPHGRVKDLDLIRTALGVDKGGGVGGEPRFVQNDWRDDAVRTTQDVGEGGGGPRLVSNSFGFRRGEEE